jgi:hypothetical protein
MDSTALVNSRPTHQMDSKNRVMADTWNCKKCSVSAHPKIVSENRVPVDLEIVTENLVTTDVWNRQHQ